VVAPGLCFGGCKGISLGNVAPVREQITDEWVPGVQCLPSGFAGLDLEDWWICGFLETKFHMFLRAGGAPGPSFVYYRPMAAGPVLWCGRRGAPLRSW
jgi:hypothetical protein